MDVPSKQNCGVQTKQNRVPTKQNWANKKKKNKMTGVSFLKILIIVNSKSYDHRMDDVISECIDWL